MDIGSASFKYDMRRLTEILAFPKAWYRRSIVRRLFLGELNISTMYEEEGESSHSGTDEEAVLQRSERSVMKKTGKQCDLFNPTAEYLLQRTVLNGHVGRFTKRDFEQKPDDG